jgi:hypothetical protein
MDMNPRLTGRTSRPNALQKPATGPKRNAPPVPHWPATKTQPRAHAASDIWPKWTTSHRQSVDRELTLWQEQFDARDTRRHDG